MPADTRAQSLTCTDIDGAQLFADREQGHTYLGFFGTSTASDSVMNPNTAYGNPDNLNGSVRGNGIYGSTSGTAEYSANNPEAEKPPLIVKNGAIIGHLTTNASFDEPVPLAGVDVACTFSSTAALNAGAPAPVAVEASDEPFIGNLELHGALRVSWARATTNIGLPVEERWFIELSETVDGPRTPVAADDLIIDVDAPGISGLVTVTGLVPEQQYFVWLTMENAAGRQFASFDLGTPQYVVAGEPAAPVNLSVTPGWEKLTLSFDPPGNDGGRPVLRYE